MKVLRILTVAVVVLVVAVGAGCGGDDEGNGGEPATTTEQAGGGEATTVDMDEYSFSPEDVNVERGATITVENKGGIAHNLTVEQGPDPKKKTKRLAGTSAFLGGKSEKLEVDLRPGKYAMVCTVPGHRELGMVGTFTVK
jgi:plastocyanin